MLRKGKGPSMLTDLLQNVTKQYDYENYVRQTEMYDVYEMVTN